MPAGKLSVTPCTINGLAENGYPTSHTFIGCYVSQAEKQRTNSASGPEPHFQDTLKCNVGEHGETLYLDVINEDPSRPGPVGSAKLPLASVFTAGTFENWVPLAAPTGQHLGHIYVKLAFTPESAPAYGGYDQKTESPHTPVPEQRALYGEQQPAYASPSQAYQTGSPSPYPVGAAAGAAGVAGAAASYGAGNTYAPVAGTPPIAGTPPVDGATGTTAKPKKNAPEWMKYGGAALAGAAAVGLGAWAVDALGSDEEEERAEAEKRAFEAGQQSSEQETYQAYEQQRSFNEEQEEIYEERREREEELHEERLKEEQERYEERLEEEEERREEEQERYEERLEEEEERREEEEERREEEEEEREEAEEERLEEEEERREDEEERREEEEEEREEEEEERREEEEERLEEEEERREEEEERREEEEEEREEEYEDREIQPERPAVNDSKWR